MSARPLEYGEAFLAPRLQEALLRAGGLHTLGDVFRRVQACRAQYWQSDDERGAIVTEIQQYPAGKVVNYWLAAGEMRAVMSLPPRIEAWAREQGCTIATAMGRPGWIRLIGPAGRALGTAFLKEL